MHDNLPPISEHERERLRDLFVINGQQQGFAYSVENEQYDDAHDFRKAKDRMINEYEEKYGYLPYKDFKGGYH